MNTFFIVTPFGLKNGIDFSRVEQELIQPALQAAPAAPGSLSSALTWQERLEVQLLLREATPLIERVDR